MYAIGVRPLMASPDGRRPTRCSRVSVPGPAPHTEHEIAERCPAHASLKQGARVSTQQVGQIIPLADVETAGQHAQDMAVD